MVRLLAAPALALAISACAGAPAASPAPPAAAASAAATAAPTPAAAVYKAELKPSNQNPAITDAEASCSGTATVTVSGSQAKFDLTVTGCPPGTAINIGHIHEGAAGANGPVKVDSTLKAGDLVLSGGGATISRTVPIDPAVATALAANPAGFYVNLHSTLHAGGVVRGQLTRG